MTRLRWMHVLFLIIAALAVLPAPARADLIDERREELDRTAAALRLTRERIDELQDWLDQGRIYLAPLPLPLEEPRFALVTHDEAVRYWSYFYLDSVLRGVVRFSSDDLAEHVRTRMAEGRQVIGQIRQEIAQLRDREAELLARRNALEDEVAELQGPQRTGACVDLQGVTARTRLGESVDAAPGALMHGVRTGGDTGRGWTSDFTLSWTAPPDRLCVGEQFEVTLTVTNNAPVPNEIPGRAALISMGFSVPHLHWTCSNPPGFDPTSAAFVAAHEGGYSNTCTVEVRGVGDRSRPIALINMSLEAVPHFGTLSYVYQ